MIVTHTNKMIDVNILSKICATCLCIEKRVEEVVEHYCPNINKENRKGMEATEGLDFANIIKRRGLIVEYLVVDDKISIKATPRHRFDAIKDIYV